LNIDLNQLLSEVTKERLVIGHVTKEDLMRFSNIIAQIRRVDKYPESTDVRIVAYSMADKDCQGLLTFERKLIESAGLKRFITDHVKFKRSYSITDDPYPR
jgi:hypothetical protein